ncbi:MAG: hypothetical protein ACRERV_13950, partial [Methylococcales bacterium]
HPNELKIALREDQPYRPGVVAGYPLLMEAGQELVRASINFYDLTRLFVANRDALYVDDCCHLSPAGYALVAKEIARRIGGLCIAGSRS